MSINELYLTNKKYWQVTGTNTIWDGFKFGIPGLYYYYDNDFVSYVADEWTVTEVETTGSTTQTLLDAAGGVLRLATGTTEDDGNNLQLGGTANGETTGESFNAVADKYLFFEALIRSNDVTQHDFFVGLHVQDTTLVAGRGSDYIGFRTDDGDAFLDVENTAASTITQTTEVERLVNSSWVKLGFRITGTTQIDFFVNDRIVSTSTTNIPTELMKLSIGSLTGEADSAQLDLDYIRIYQER